MRLFGSLYETIKIVVEGLEPSPALDIEHLDSTAHDQHGKVALMYYSTD